MLPMTQSAGGRAGFEPRQSDICGHAIYQKQGLLIIAVLPRFDPIIHSLAHLTFTKYLLCTWPRVRSWGYGANVTQPCSLDASGLPGKPGPQWVVRALGEDGGPWRQLRAPQPSDLGGFLVEKPQEGIWDR